MQPFDQGQGFEIQRPNVIETGLTFGRLDRLDNGFHVQRPLLFYRLAVGGALFSPLVAQTIKGAR
jgi:hypothetical protein